MKRKRYSVEQIVAILKQAEVGVPVAELIRQVGISEQTFYRWKKHYVGLEVDQVRQLRQVQEENVRLKRLVAELILDKTSCGNTPGAVSFHGSESGLGCGFHSRSVSRWTALSRLNRGGHLQAERLDLF